MSEIKKSIILARKRTRNEVFHQKTARNSRAVLRTFEKSIFEKSVLGDPLFHFNRKPERIDAESNYRE